MSNQNNEPLTVVIGDVMLDKYVYGTVERVSPESCCPILKETSCEYQLGGAANVAKQLRRMGANVVLIGIVGKDNNGERIRQLLTQEKIDISFLFNYDTVTICKTRYINDLHLQMFRKDTEAFFSFTPDDEKAILESISKKTIDSIVISDYNKGTVSKTLCHKVICWANRLDIDIIVDIKEPDIHKYKGATIVKGNKTEIRNLLEQLPDKKSTKGSLIQLRKALDTKILVVTCGENGIMAVDENATFTEYPCQKQMVFDVTGAGDIVTSYISFFLNKKNMSFDRILYYSNKAASIKIGRLGNSYVGINEVLNESKKTITTTEFTKLKNGSKVVFTNGCFDIVHAGHIDLLQKAKREGDILVVGLNSDDSIKKIKGANRPVNKLELRIKILSSIQYVDYIIVFDDDTPIKIIEAIKPDVLVKGGDYSFNNIVGADYVCAHGGRVITIPFIYNISTTDIINKIK